VSLRLGGALTLFPWIPLGSTAILTAVGAIIAPSGVLKIVLCGRRGIAVESLTAFTQR